MQIADQARKALSTLCVLSVIAVCGAAPGNARSDEMDVKIGFYPGTTFLIPLYVADAKGYFKQAGLKYTLIPVANGPLMNSQMGSGAIDFGFQPPSNVGLAREQGMDQVFLVGNVTMPWVLIARKGPQWIVGLPGNPVSSYVTAFLFLLPLLRRLVWFGCFWPGQIVNRAFWVL